jgi:hypothetical protein
VICCNGQCCSPGYTCDGGKCKAPISKSSMTSTGT